MATEAPKWTRGLSEKQPFRLGGKETAREKSQGGWKHFHVKDS